MGQIESFPFRKVRVEHTARRERLLALAAVVFLFSLPGCALWPRGGEVGSGVAYVHGDHSRLHEGGYKQVWKEALRTVSAMGMEVIRLEVDDMGGTITARRKDDTSIKLQVNPAG